MNKDEILADEELIVRDGGEIPEVTYHSSVFYLTEDEDGPQLSLNGEEMRRLKQAVIQGYRAIIIRDLIPDNRDKGLYRGLGRCCVNWQRLKKFCGRENFDLEPVRIEMGLLLKKFMGQEVAEVNTGSRHSSINCDPDDINCLCEHLLVDTAELPEGWRDLCYLKD